MLIISPTDNQKYWIWFAASLAVASLGCFAPARHMPLEYDAMLWRSIPLATFWALMLGFCLLRYKKRGLWLLVAAPLALYWPMWLMFHGFPSCYYSGNCV
jgi:hypothetical protein